MVEKRGRGRPKGYPRSGGMKKGYRYPATIAKEAAREAVRQRINERLGELVDAQIDSAIGLAHFFLRDEASGQWKRITNPRQIEDALNGKTDKYLIYTKDPNAQAAREMLDRAIDRPKEQEQVVKVDNLDELIAELQAARQYAAKARRED